MKSSTAIKERRQTRRYQMRNGGFAVCMPNYNRLGQILDISDQGLAMRYIDADGEPELPKELAIMFTPDEYYLPKIPCKIVTEKVVLDKISKKSVTIKRCGLKFGSLTPHQRSQLNNFIQNYAIPE